VPGLPRAGRDRDRGGSAPLDPVHQPGMPHAFERESPRSEGRDRGVADSEEGAPRPRSAPYQGTRRSGASTGPAARQSGPEPRFAALGWARSDLAVTGPRVESNYYARFG